MIKNILGFLNVMFILIPAYLIPKFYLEIINQLANKNNEISKLYFLGIFLCIMIGAENFGQLIDRLKNK